MTARQRRVLAAICEAFAPRLDGWPSAEEAGVPDAIVEAAALRGESRRLEGLLALWERLAAPGRRPFTALPPERREAALLAWCDSRVPQRRAAFQALRRAVVVSYYFAPAAWGQLGYPGLAESPTERSPGSVSPTAVSRDLELGCDVCVVGSGAGGGTAAAVLAAAGLDVVVLEAGDHLGDADFPSGEREGLRRLYLDGGTATTSDHGIVLLAGACLGGGTVVNYTTCFRTPDDVRAEWAAAGATAFAESAYEGSLDAVWAGFGVNSEHSRPSARDELFRRGLERLGWHVGRIARNVRGCDQGALCGSCPYGCRLGAKRSAPKTWLADAQPAGARILVRTRALRVRVERGEARGVEARAAGGHRVGVRSRAVVVACGALETPVLLRRSGLSNENVGRHLRLHPVTGLAGLFDEEIRPWEGTMQAIYSDEHGDLDAGYGVKYETAAVHPSLAAALLPWRGSRPHAELMTRLPNLVGLGVLLRDRGEGEVRAGRRGRTVRYRVSAYDARHVRAGIEGAARILEAAGARRVVSSHARWVSFDPGRDGDVTRFMRDADACGYGPGRCLYASFHQLGSARMGASPRTSACDPEGVTWEVRNLVVCDGSAFPTASGVNPMISIAATAHLNATRLAERLRS